ncbi:MAG: universal stress protein [Candidatus Thiodiazotropha taylori]|nr:universal stress protein [Candidatus Thiodiazotropha taylori]MCW4292980.1 universal stress protein [Candidatus Thiodiazotropha taylori]
MKRFKNILFFADGSKQADHALERAFLLAESNHARLTLLDVIEPIDIPQDFSQRFDFDLQEILKQQRLEQLEELAEPFRTADNLVYAKVLVGKPFLEVIKAVISHGYDLVIKSARCCDGLSDRLLGSTDLHLLRKCPSPVWVDRPGADSEYKQVLAAVDPMAEASDNCASLVMDLATSLAHRETAQLSVAHAWKMKGESMLRDGRSRLSQSEFNLLINMTEMSHKRKLQALLENYGMSTDDSAVKLVHGDASKVIHQLSDSLNADLIVMGTVGRTGVPGLFIGNTAEDVLQTTKASILAVKPPNFVSPVK